MKSLTWTEKPSVVTGQPNHNRKQTKSQAVTRPTVADRTASKHLQLFLEIFGSKRVGVTGLFGVACRHRSRDRLIPHRPNPIGRSLKPTFICNGFRDIQRRM